VRLLKVVAEGITCSFRYPHFMQQIHPSYQMPPPATIYGHICSAVGEWVDPSAILFAYHFTYLGETDDTEHIILVTASRGKLPGSAEPKVLEGTVNPFSRHIFFQPRLVLYLNRPEWAPAFQSPRYAVTLGRSQDLFTYTSVQVIDAERRPAAYFEHTLLPYEMALQVMRGIVALMPRYLDYQDNRRPTFQRYTVLQERVRLESEGGFWVDPSSPEYEGSHLGLAFLSFVDGPYAPLSVA
jgi:CRISPR-associated protein Cas5t